MANEVSMRYPIAATGYASTFMHPVFGAFAAEGASPPQPLGAEEVDNTKNYMLCVGAGLLIAWWLWGK